MGLGRREKFGGAQLSRKEGRKKSLLSASCTPGKETDGSSFLDRNLWLGQRKGNPNLFFPPHILLVLGPRRSEANHEPDGPAALRLCLRRERSGPARGGVGETIGKAEKGGTRQKQEAGHTNLFQIFLSF